MQESETGNNAAVNFLGRVLRTQPEILETLSPRDTYILFSHSDQKEGRSSPELGEILGLSGVRIAQIYKRSVEKVFENARLEIQESIPLTTIFEAASTVSLKAGRRRISSAYRTKVKETFSGGELSLETKMGRYKIDPSDSDLWRYAQSHNLIERIAKYRLMSSAELAILSGYFSGQDGSRQATDLLDRFSISVARLA